MRTNVLQGNEPWKTAFNDLKKQTSLNFVPCPIAFVSEDAYGVNSFGGKEFYQSAMAAYKHSLVWYITFELLSQTHLCQVAHDPSRE